MNSHSWISVKDRLPHVGEHVLVWNGCCAQVGFQDSNREWKSIYGIFYITPTLWMYLPDPPKPEDPFTMWWNSKGKWVGCHPCKLEEYAKQIWDAAIASQKTDKQQP